ncbi:MAG: hypothetical protein LWY06_06840 [Firmicutes bacterium]|nr:hypothetical protein [Bacillota bacterium]
MSLDKKNITRIENFKKQDSLNNKLFIVLMCMIVIFLAANVFAIVRLCAEFHLSFPEVLELTKHVEISRNPDWYETHIIRRLGYIALGLFIAIFFPIFYTMARNDMLTLASLYDELKKYQSAGGGKSEPDKADNGKAGDSSESKGEA